MRAPSWHVCCCVGTHSSLGHVRGIRMCYVLPACPGPCLVTSVFSKVQLYLLSTMYETCVLTRVAFCFETRLGDALLHAFDRSEKKGSNAVFWLELGVHTVFGYTWIFWKNASWMPARLLE